MSVNNGELANATTFNTSFVSKEVDSTVAARVNLNDALSESGASAANVQRELNSLNSFAGKTINTAKDVKPSWVNNDVGASANNLFERADALTLEFNAASGHTHSGASGEGGPISATYLADFNRYFAIRQSFNVNNANGNSTGVATQMIGKSPGGDTSTAGVVTSSPYNKVVIVEAATLTGVEDAQGQRVYGRLTESAGAWTLTYYTNEAGVETAHSLTTTNITVFYNEVFDQETRPTFNEDAGFVTLDLTADIADAASGNRGLVSTGTQQFLGSKSILGDLTVTGAITASGAIRSNTSLILEEPDSGTNTITIKADTALATTYTLTLPTTAGTDRQVLTTNGSGVLTWEDTAGASGGGGVGGSDTQVQFNNAGFLDGDAEFIWDHTDKKLRVGSAMTPGILTQLQACKSGTSNSPQTAFSLAANRSSGSPGVGFGVSQYFQLARSDDTFNSTIPAGAIQYRWLDASAGIETSSYRLFGQQSGTAVVVQYSESASGYTGLGLNNTSPTRELDVNGNARIRGLTTAGLLITDTSGNISSNGSGNSDNYLTNGIMEWWQRGTSSTNNTKAFLADRWWHTRTGTAGITVTRQTAASVPPAQYATRVQRDSGNSSTVALILNQDIESAVSRRAAGKFMTISFWARKGANYSATSDLLNVKVQTGTGTDQTMNSGYTSEASAIDQNATLTTSFQKFTYTTSAVIGSTITQLGVKFTMTPTGTASTNDWFEVTNIQLNEGTIAYDPAFFGGTPDNEIAQISRFYTKSYALTVTAASSTFTGAYSLIGVGAVGAAAMGGQFKVRMRAAPTVTIYHPGTGTVNSVYRVDTAAAVTVTGAAQISETGFAEVGAAGGGGTSFAQSFAYYYQWVAETEI